MTEDKPRRGRPPKNRRSATIRINPGLWEKLEEVSKAMKKDRSDIIEQLVADFLEGKGESMQQS